ncbi:hypothetical protein BGZ74_002322, partial [Mortierella antarctica]
MSAMALTARGNLYFSTDNTIRFASDNGKSEFQGVFETDPPIPHELFTTVDLIVHGRSGPYSFSGSVDNSRVEINMNGPAGSGSTGAFGGPAEGWPVMRIYGT